MSEQSNVQVQTEKLNILKQEFELVNAKIMTSEKENEALIHKLASLTLKMQEFEELFNDKQAQLDAVISLRDALMAENDELRASNRFLSQNQQEDKEVSEKSPTATSKTNTKSKTSNNCR